MAEHAEKEKPESPYGPYAELGEVAHNYVECHDEVEVPGVFGTAKNVVDSYRGFQDAFDPSKKAEERIVGGAKGVEGAAGAGAGVLSLGGFETAAKFLGAGGQVLGAGIAGYEVGTYGSKVLQETGILGKNEDGKTNRDASDLASDWGTGARKIFGNGVLGDVAEVGGTLVGSAVGGMMSVGAAGYGLLRDAANAPLDMVKQAAAEIQQGQADVHEFYERIGKGESPEAASKQWRMHAADKEAADQAKLRAAARQVGLDVAEPHEENQAVRGAAGIQEAEEAQKRHDPLQYQLSQAQRNYSRILNEQAARGNAAAVQHQMDGVTAQGVHANVLAQMNEATQKAKDANEYAAHYAE
jgi:hypothetical protein